ncbi:MAG: hypothetical protein OWR52_09755 [Acidibacillus sp.]|nr:hypothetical protein [Sulfoacidibacillus ferrooxidans]MCY0893778.1 hypothetical protein [Acidibacillus sp.]
MSEQVRIACMIGSKDDVYWEEDGLSIYVTPSVRQYFGEYLILRGTKTFILSNGEESVYLGTVDPS